MLGREFAGRDAITQVASFRALGNEFSDEGVQLLMGLVTCSPWCRSAAVGGSPPTWACEPLSAGLLSEL